MCEMSKGFISWKHTTEPEEKESEGDTAGEKGEEEEVGGGQRLREREVSHGVHADDCGLGKTAAESGGLRMRHDEDP